MRRGPLVPNWMSGDRRSRVEMRAGLTTVVPSWASLLGHPAAAGPRRAGALAPARPPASGPAPAADGHARRRPPPPALASAPPRRRRPRARATAPARLPPSVPACGADRRARRGGNPRRDARIVRHTLQRPGDEIADVLVGARQVLAAQVHHVAALVEGEADPVPQLAAGLELGHRVLRAEIVGPAVVVAGLDQYLEVGIVGHGPAEHLADVRLAPAPGMNVAEDVVLQIRLEAERLAQIHVDRGREGAVPVGHRLVVLVALARGVAVDAGVAAVETAHGQAPVAEQLLAEPPEVDPQVRGIDVALGQPGVARDPAHHLPPLLALEVMPLHQGEQVVSDRELLRLVQHLTQRARLQVRRKL